MLAVQLLILFLVLFLVVIAVMAVGSYKICSGLYIRAHCRGNTKEKKLSLSFDDGPDANITARVLDLLKANNIKAAFFLIGEKADKHRNLPERMVAEGHIIGNHSYTHNNKYPFKGKKAIIDDLEKNENLIHEVCGKRVRWFRPPFGVTNPNIAGAARSLQYDVVGWSIRSLDTMGKPEAKIIKRVVKRLRPGSLILFHDTSEGIMHILEEVIAEARKQGYDFVSPDELLNLKAYK